MSNQFVFHGVSENLSFKISIILACNFTGIESKHILKKKVKEIIEKMNESEQNKWLQRLWNDTKNCDSGN
jgi:hypothetical protein